MLVLSETQVQDLIEIDELIEALEQAHIQYSTGKAVMPVRLVVPLPQIQGRITSMPGFLSDDKALAMKVVTYFQDNPKRNLPAILGTILLFSSETGKLISVMDGSYITGIRTACVSAVASKDFCRAAPCAASFRDLKARIKVIRRLCLTRAKPFVSQA